MRNTVTISVVMTVEVPVENNLAISEGTKTEINNQYRNYALGILRERLTGLDATFKRINLTKGENNND